MKRIFPNQAEAIAQSLYAIIVEKKRASSVLERCIDDHPKWGSRDRNLLYEACFNILRWKRKYNYLAANEDTAFSPWPLLKTWCLLNDYQIPDWKELDCPPRKTKEDLISTNFPNQMIEDSFPDWLYELGKKELKENWDAEAKALNTQASVALRVNRLIASPKKTATLLSEQFNLVTEQNEY